MERVEPTSELGKILVWCSSRTATDFHTQADMPGFAPLSGALLKPEADRPRVGANETNFMQTLMIIWRTIVNLAKQACLLPKTIALALQHRRQQITRHQFETERLDRIRNPSKYAGR